MTELKAYIVHSAKCPVEYRENHPKVTLCGEALNTHQKIDGVSRMG